MHINFDCFSLQFGPSKTKISNNDVVASDFFLENKNGNISATVLTKSIDSNYPTTIKYSNLIYTTCQIKSESSLLSFLNFLGFKEKESMPDWLANVSYFNDKEFQDRKEKLNIDFLNIQKEIYLNNKSIIKNKYYESILYTSGSELVNAVFDILNVLFNISSLKDFRD